MSPRGRSRSVGIESRVTPGPRRRRGRGGPRRRYLARVSQSGQVQLSTGNGEAGVWRFGRGSGVWTGKLWRLEKSRSRFWWCWEALDRAKEYSHFALFLMGIFCGHVRHTRAQVRDGDEAVLAPWGPWLWPMKLGDSSKQLDRASLESTGRGRCLSISSTGPSRVGRSRGGKEERVQKDWEMHLFWHTFVTFQPSSRQVPEDGHGRHQPWCLSMIDAHGRQSSGRQCHCSAMPWKELECRRSPLPFSICDFWDDDEVSPFLEFRSSRPHATAGACPSPKPWSGQRPYKVHS